jgi:hypothetical protein
VGSRLTLEAHGAEWEFEAWDKSHRGRHHLAPNLVYSRGSGVGQQRSAVGRQRDAAAALFLSEATVVTFLSILITFIVRFLWEKPIQYWGKKLIARF